MKESILWMLVIIGLFSLLKWSFGLIKGKKITRPKTSMVLFVYNWEENLEKIIRYIASLCYFDENLLCPVDVVIFDLGSTDQTLNIGRKLARQFYFLKVLDSSRNSVIEYFLKSCNGDVIILLDTNKLTLSELEKTIKFYFSDITASPKVLNKI
ncbi:glycosyltransferase [Anaerobranca gottschalkii]|uniref:Glycosyltransferase 2-like domain-containing protein n=1 Tax=Anaerobranca gottschalkii DSM 13577 TaxID=1120990 RepID=A0A1H9ZHW9_9FIRM|nr:hypothetical protein [Anaerobranca gottschalkii]SES81271.1 hypothetical protein SAMN03080614_100949 [Anaerobranca gottschalkii DSM 13577]